MPVIGYILTALAAYLLGSIPTGFLVAKARGVDIRTAGSGNIGATNAFRILGKGPGIFVLLVDAFKGWLAVALIAPLIARIFPGEPRADYIEYLQITAGITAILGHNYTCWLHFKGGKGIATSAGALLALVPWALIIILTLFIVLFLATHYVSVGSIAAALALPFATYFTTGHDLGLTAITGMIGALAIYKHRLNIRRLMNGTENRINFKKKEAAP